MNEMKEFERRVKEYLKNLEERDGALDEKEPMGPDEFFSETEMVEETGRGIDVKNFKADYCIVKSAYGLVESVTDKRNVSRISEHLDNLKPVFESHKKIFIENLPDTDFYDRLLVLGEVIQYETHQYFVAGDKHVYHVHTDKNELAEDIMVDIYFMVQKPEYINEALTEFLKAFQDVIETRFALYNIKWYFNTDRGIKYKHFNERIKDKFYQEAYPYIDMEKLAEGYIRRDEPIILFIGPPGTGKTRLIRYILRKMAAKKSSRRELLYTADKAVIESGEIFTEFLLGNYDAIVLEDIDYHLRGRKEGNDSMYKMLSVSNGLITTAAAGKKIFLSTNLTSADNIDEALLRPGRCYSMVKFRLLSRDESEAFLKTINADIKLPSKEKFSLAELYRLAAGGELDATYKGRTVGF